MFNKLVDKVKNAFNKKERSKNQEKISILIPQNLKFKKLTLKQIWFPNHVNFKMSFARSKHQQWKKGVLSA